MSTSPDSYSRDYIVTTEQIGFSFTYPPEYLGVIGLVRQIMTGHEGGLGIWVLRSEVSVRFAKLLGPDLPSRRLVPFVRFDNGDWIALFDADQPGKIFVANLGETPSVLYEQVERTCMEFLQSVCRNLDLPWPNENQSSEA